MRRSVSTGCDTFPMIGVLKANEKETALQQSSTVWASGSKIFKMRQLTIGLDLGERFSYYCVLDEARQGAAKR